MRKNLTMVQILTLCNSNCPDCNKFLAVKSQIEGDFFTTIGICKDCHKFFWIKRTHVIPYQVIAGYEYSYFAS